MVSLRKATSLTLAFSFLTMTYTGIMLFLAPHGRVAYWSNWTLLGLGKEQYAQIHTASMVVFILFGALHIYYNFKAIVSYLKDRSTKAISWKKSELLVALGINLFVILGTLYMVQPIKAFLDFQDGIKAYWAKTQGEPPYGHAEESSLRAFSKKTDLDPVQAEAALKAKGLAYEAGWNMQTIAERNHMTPQQVYEIIRPKGENAAHNAKSDITRLGQKTLRDLAQMGRIDLSKAQALIRSRGYTDVSPENRMKAIADELGTTPFALFKELERTK